MKCPNAYWVAPIEIDIDRNAAEAESQPRIESRDSGSGQSRRAKGSMPSLLRRISSRVRPWSSWGKTSQRSVSWT